MKIPPATTTGAAATQRSNRAEKTVPGVEKLAEAGGEATGLGAGALPVDSFESSASSPLGALLDGGRRVWSRDLAPTTLEALPDRVDTSPASGPTAPVEHERASIPVDLDRTGNAVAPPALPTLQEVKDALLDNLLSLLQDIWAKLSGGSSPAALTALIDAINTGFDGLVHSARASFDQLIGQAPTTAERDQLTKEREQCIKLLQEQREKLLALAEES